MSGHGTLTAAAAREIESDGVVSHGRISSRSLPVGLRKALHQPTTRVDVGKVGPNGAVAVNELPTRHVPLGVEVSDEHERRVRPAALGHHQLFGLDRTDSAVARQSKRELFTRVEDATRVIVVGPAMDKGRRRTVVAVQGALRQRRTVPVVPLEPLAVVLGKPEPTLVNCGAQL